MDFRLNLLICVVLSYIQTGLCIDCHQCASWGDIGCIDPYVNDNIDGCDDRDTHCVKIKMVNKLYDSGFITGDPRISVTASRGCVRADGEGEYCRAKEIGAGIMIRCLCKTDGCNTARTLVPSLALTFTWTLIVLLLWRRP